MSMKMTAFWDVAPCSLVEVDWLSEVHTASIRGLQIEKEWSTLQTPNIQLKTYKLTVN
jgi:hypothetical protein